MKLTLFLCVFLAVVSIVFSGQSLIPKQPGTPGHCYSEETGAMNKGDVKEIKGKECGQATCGPDGTIAIHTCGTAVVNGKPVKPDLSKPYPECCQPRLDK